MFQLVGDGIHDDTQAIQALLDSKKGLVELPMPTSCYLISKPLRIYSYQELKFPRYARIKLAKGSNCAMLTNANKEAGDEYVTVCGGIWDYNNLEQARNPLIDNAQYLSQTDSMSYGLDEEKYEGMPFIFFNIKHFTVKNLTLKDPVTFACSLDRVTYFTVENIVFDFNKGNPYPINMDGIHLNGNCHFGKIQNIRGATYDDMIALNADEGSDGPITNIEIDGLYAERAQSFVRLLTVKNEIRNIHIRNVYGTCFMYGIGITKFYYGAKTTGYYDNLTFDNIYISRGEPVLHEDCHREGLDTFAIVDIDRETVIKSLHIADLYRHETHTPVPTIRIQEGAEIENLSLENSKSDTSLQSEFPFIQNDGEIGFLRLENVRHTAGEFWSGKQIKK